MSSLHSLMKEILRGFYICVQGTLAKVTCMYKICVVHQARPTRYKFWPKHLNGSLIKWATRTHELPGGHMHVLCWHVLSELPYKQP